MRRPVFLPFLLRILTAATALVLALPLLGWLLVRGSLPLLGGTVPLGGLSEAVVIERDANGVPTLHAHNREDLARALGFLHAQDRFFQMDLLRRQATGELAELFGPAAAPMDQLARQHLFHRRATSVLAAATPEQLRVVDAYAAGVNAGIGALHVRPWEYLALRAPLRPWKREDCVLVLDAMTMTLETDGSDERSRQAIAQTYSDEAEAFLWPVVTARDAALDGTTAPAPPVPDAAHFTPASTSPLELHPPQPLLARNDLLPDLIEAGELRAGSNSFALSGTRTASGSALVANDPHLQLAVPTLWYRASLVLPDRAITGATLPGVPGMVIGSNGAIAWGFTNSYIDTCDLVIIETDPDDANRYRVPDGNGWEPFQHTSETINVHGAPARACDVLTTRWGPLITRPGAGGPVYARHWSEYEPGATNLTLLDLAFATSVDEAIALAHRGGIHPQNFVVGDRAGNIAWTIFGQVPRRVGFDGQRPQSWADGSRRWDGFLPADQIPVVRNPPQGQLWTANNRILGGDALALLGTAGYGEPARAAQIRDRLGALPGRPATPADLLAIQLDDESRFLWRWRDLLLRTINDPAVAAEPGLAELSEIVTAWNDRADADQAGHRLVRQFRSNVSTMVMNPIFAPVRLRDPVAGPGSKVEQPLWSILEARPPHLLPSAFSSWDELLRRAARLAAKPADYRPVTPTLADCTWGARNRLAMNHPLAQGLPKWFADRLDMPHDPLPGDANMPRVQAPDFGASMRMVVSPGFESEGLFEQPGGASGHPMSPFYRTGHRDWVEGNPTPLLPGPARYRMELQPATAAAPKS